MPSVTATRLQLTLAGGSTTFVPARISPAPLRLVCSGSAPGSGPGTGTTTLGPITLKLDRLQRQTGYFDAQGRPTPQMQTLWQRHCEALEQFAARISQQVTDNSNIIAQILAANALAAAANGTANAVLASTSLANSYTDPVSVLAADNTGAITIAAHTRRYTDGTSVAVDAGSLSGFASGNYVTVFYEDAGREGGAVAFQGTTSAVSQEGNVHIVGSVAIPNAGDPPANGTSPTAPGFTPPADGDGLDYR